MAPVMNKVPYVVKSFTTKLCDALKKNNTSTMELLVSPFYWTGPDTTKGPLYWQPIWDFDTTNPSDCIGFVNKQINASPAFIRKYYYVEVTGNGYHLVCKRAYYLNKPNNISELRNRCKREYKPVHASLDVVSSIRDMPIRRTLSAVSRKRKNGLEFIIPLDLEEFLQHSSKGGYTALLDYCIKKQQHILTNMFSNDATCLNKIMLLLQQYMFPVITVESYASEYTTLF